jgi:hypothetical protein
MPLRNEAYLEVQGDSVTAPDGTDASGAGVFHFPNVESTQEFTKQMLVGNRGQVISEIASLVPGSPGEGADGAGFNLDFGQGLQTFTLSFSLIEANTEPTDWGDGSGSAPLDAASDGRQTQLQTLGWWARKTRTGSQNTAKLYWGDFSDGTYAASAGVFNGPINVRIVSVTLPYQKDEPSRSTPEIELARTSTAPDIISDDPTPTN